MVGLRGILSALMIGSALVALPVEAQSRGSSSLTHTVSVTVPARVKVRVASLSASSSAAASIPSAPSTSNGLSLTVSATQAWVLAIRSGSGAATKSHLQWSADGRSQFSAVMTRDVPIASGVKSVVLTVSAP